MRSPAPRSTDARHFRNTAFHTKAVNLVTNVKRGGIRF